MSNEELTEMNCVIRVRSLKVSAAAIEQAGAQVLPSFA
jgi:hypothetical protein